MTRLLYQTNSYLRDFAADVIEVVPDERAGDPGPDGVLPGRRRSATRRRHAGSGWADLGGDESREARPVRRGSRRRRGAADARHCRARRARLGAALPPDAHAHRDARPLRGDLARVRRAGDGRADVPSTAHGWISSWKTSASERVRQIEERANAAIAAGAPVSVRILPREDAFAIPDLIRTKINLLPPGIAEVRVVSVGGARHPSRWRHPRRRRTRSRAG